MAVERNPHRIVRRAAIVVAVATCIVVIGVFSVAPRERRLAAGAFAATPPGIENLGSSIEHVRAPYGLPGMAAAVFNSERIVAAGAAGTRKVGSGVTLAVDDRFPIASIAKTMTATVVARLIERGLLAWDTPLGQLFPELQDMHPDYRSVTVELLLRHAAGLARWMRNDDVLIGWVRTHPGAGPATLRNEAVKFMLRQPPESPPGTRYHYTNDSYLILGTICERVAGRSYEALLREELFEPLQMTQSGFGEPWADRSLSQPWGHVRRWYGFRPFGPRPVDYGDISFGSPYGAIVHGSVIDLARYGMFHLQGELGLNAGLSAETFRRLHHAARAPAAGGEIAAAGFFNGGRLEADGRWTEVQHWGYYARGRTLLWFSPQGGVGVVILTNGTDEDEVKGMQPLTELARDLVRRFRTPPESSGRDPE